MRASLHKLHCSIGRLERQYQHYNAQAKEQLSCLQSVSAQLPELESEVTDASQLQDSLTEKRAMVLKLDQLEKTVASLLAHLQAIDDEHIPIQEREAYTDIKVYLSHPE